MIVEANEAFARISNFMREEMIGQSHNMVRHPDMSPEAFADLWRDLKAGRPWRGIIKNRRKDGGYYWVVANASPVRERGQLIGYQSVRSRPARAEVAAAESAYQRINAGDTSPRIENGRVVKRRPAWLARLLSLRCQMILADVAQQVGLATSCVDSGMQHSQTSAQTQSEATSTAAAAIEEVTVSIGEVAAHAKETVDTAIHAGGVSRQGAEVTRNASRTIESLADTVRRSVGQVESLGQRSEEISRLTGVIKEIAEQNVAVVSETSATVGYLNSVVGRMRRAVTQYTV